MDYVTYDDTGKLTGYYKQDLAAAHADCHIELHGNLPSHWTTYRANDERTDLVEITAVDTTPALKSRLISSVDDVIAGVSSRWLRFEAEYIKREAAARAFVAAGYVGDPGIWVTAFSTAVGMSNTAAANLIIFQADQLHGALEELGALRMAKYGIQGAANATAAQQAYDTIIAQVDAIVAGL